MHLRRGSSSHKILKQLLIGGGFLVISTFAPLGGAMIVKGFISDYFRNKKFEKDRLLRDLRRLQDREMVDYRELPNGKIKIVLTKLGQRQMLVSSLDDLKLKKGKWDGKWRLVMFDIPHSKKMARDALRQKLKLLDFYPIQKSVFITPYHCENEIDFLCSIFDIRKHVLIFIVSSFEGAEKLKHYFGI